MTLGDPRTQIWNRLLSTPPPVTVECIRIRNSRTFEDQEIRFTPATLIVGCHGGGKTLLLRLLESAFGYTVHNPPFVGASKYRNYGKSYVGGVLDVEVSVGGKQVTRTIDLSLYEEDRQAVWGGILPDTFWARFISSTELASEFSFYYQQLDVERFQEERRYSSKELSAIRNILGRKYDSVTSRTIILDQLTESDGSETIALAPYIRAESGSHSFESPTLSLGETWVHQVFWEHSRLNEGSLLLLDEPESFLATRGHRPFIDEIARKCLNPSIQLVAATHSPEILSRFPVTHTRMCIRSQSGKLRVIEPDSFRQIENAIGVEAPTKAIVLVEDNFAAKVLFAILSQVTGIPSGLEIVAAGGKNKVLAGVDALRNSKRVLCLGVLDADQRNLSRPEAGIFTLPGTADPENELLNTLADHASEIGIMLGRSEGKVLSALEAAAFLDHQYQPSILARYLEVDEAHLVNVLIERWLAESKVLEEARNLCAALVGV